MMKGRKEEGEGGMMKGVKKMEMKERRGKVEWRDGRIGK